MNDSIGGKMPFHQYTPLIMMYYFFAPMEDLMTGSAGTVAKYIAMIIMFFGIYANNWELHLTFNKVNKALLYMLVLSAASCLWAMDRAVAIHRNVAYLTVPGLAFFVGQLEFSKREREAIITAAILGGVATVGYLFFTGKISLTGTQRLNLVQGNDQNGFAALLYLPMCLSFGRVLQQKDKKRPIYAMLVFIFLFIILMTGSRGGLLASFLFVLTFAFFSQKGKRAKTMIAVVAMLVIAYYVVLPMLPDSIQQRLFDNKSYKNTIDSEHNRVAFWKLGITKIFPQNPILGVGAGCTPVRMIRVYGSYRGMHNTYINMLCEFGILGLPVFLWMLWNLFLTKKREGNSLEMALLVGMCLIVFFLDAYAKKFFWNVIMLLMIEADHKWDPQIPR